MRTLEAIAISKTILDNLNANKDDLINEFTKNGFVSVDGTVKQYQPGTYSFVDVTYDDLKDYINTLLPNKWSSISFKQIINELQNGLPQLSTSEVLNYKSYIEQYLVVINNDLVETRLNELLNQNKEYLNLTVTIDNGRDVTNQLIIMKQNNIFTDRKTRYLYKFKDGEFLIFKLNDVMGLLNSYLTNEDNPIKLSDVQRNTTTYLTSLEDIHDIRVEIRNKSKKERTLIEYEDDYKKILKLIKNY